MEKCHLDIFSKSIQKSHILVKLPQRNQKYHVEVSGVTLLEGARGQGMAGWPID